MLIAGLICRASPPKNAQKPYWRGASSEEAHSWLMYKKVSATAWQSLLCSPPMLSSGSSLRCSHALLGLGICTACWRCQHSGMVVWCLAAYGDI